MKLVPDYRYWNAIFFAFFCAYLLPLGSGPVNAVFYAGILLPAFLFSLRQDYLDLLASRHFLIVVTLCMYALVRATSPDIALDVAKFLVIFLALSLAALSLPLATVEATRRTALFFLIALIAYILANTIHQGVTQHWLPGQRLAPMFGNLKSVIFCADLVISALVVYSWTCLTMRDYRPLLIANAVVIVFVLGLLQSRSVLPVWLGSMSALLIFSVPAAERRRFLLYLGIFITTAAIVFINIPELLARGDSYRFEIWSGYLSSTLSCSAFIGCGWGVELPFTTADGSKIAHPHSMYVQHLFWGGIVGLTLLLLALVPPIFAGIRRAHYAAWALLPGCIALAFDGKSLIAQPNERWFLVTVPLAILIATLTNKNGDIAPIPANAATDKQLS